MIRICEARIEDFEDRYCKQSNSRLGNVFNAWKEIQRGNRFASHNNKRIKKTNEKVKDNEKIYIP